MILTQESHTGFKEGSGQQTKIFNELVSYMQQEFFDTARNRMDISDKRKVRLNALTGGDLDKIKNCLENDLASLLGVINQKIKTDIRIIPQNSLRDMLGNISTSYLSSYVTTLDSLRSERQVAKAQEMLTGQFVLIFEYFAYYITELLADSGKKGDSKRKLKKELEGKNGYVSEFSQYLQDESILATSVIRLVLFYFFSKLEKGYLNYGSEFNDVLKKANKVIEGGLERYLKIEKIKTDFNIK